MRISTRTGALALLAALVVAPGSVVACDQREPTRETGPGPHDYTMGVPDTKLWRDGDPGEPLFLRLRVLDTCGEPVPGARVRILHANHLGYHEADRWRAELETDERGEFRIGTVFPGYTGGLPRHIHFRIQHPDHPELVTRLFFKNDPSVDHGIEDLAMVLEEVYRDDRRGWIAGYEFVLQPR